MFSFSNLNEKVVSVISLKKRERERIKNIDIGN